MPHLEALELRMCHERARLAGATSKSEREIRAVWVAQIENEIARERTRHPEPEETLTDDELMQALTSP